LRSDEQLVALFRDGYDEAFRTIHDRYRQRLFAYTRQMLPGSRQDAEDALQDVFVRAYSGLRANDRELTLRAWLYRVAHNRCVDELRRPVPPAPELLDRLHAPSRDPVLEAEQRDSLRRLVEDVRRLPDQQRSALLMRELGGMPYNDIAGALGVSVAAVKSLLVRARIGLAQAAEARDTACCEIREELILAHDRGVRPSGLARRHMHECASCRGFRAEIRGVSRQLAGLVAPIGPLGMAAHLLGLGGGGGAAAAGGGAGAGAAGAGAAGAGAAGAGAAGAGAAGAGAAAIGGSAATAGAGFVAVGHVATLLAAAVVTAGGAVELQHTLSTPSRHTHAARHVATAAPPATPRVAPTAAATQTTSPGRTYPATAAVARTAATRSRSHKPAASKPPRSRTAGGLVKQLTSSVTDSVPATGGSGIGDGSDGTVDGGTSAPTDTGAPTTGSDTAPSTGSTSTGTDTGDSSTGPAGSSTSTPSAPVLSTTSDPNATTSSAGGSAGNPPANGSPGTDSNTGSGSSGSGSSGSNWPL
jgi:RNA polymerase sigma factor (sigma-70 family)